MKHEGRWMIFSKMKQFLALILSPVELIISNIAINLHAPTAEM